MAILGIDEVGRGPWAGPLVIGAVILPEKHPDWVEKLRDSKKLSEKRRATLSEIILKESLATGLGWVPAHEIDEIGLAAALRLATRRALHALRQNSQGISVSEIIIDGPQNFLSDTIYADRTSTLIKGDDLIKEISAASIIAKVARDNYMIELSKKYPEFGFDANKGYGTKKHIAALKTYGPTPEHRLSLKPIRRQLHLLPETEPAHPQPFKKSSKNTTKIGQLAEAFVAKHLENHGHEIICRNYKTTICEIDLISTKDQTIYFTEVKYRRSPDFGNGLDAITPLKKRQMEFAAKVFLANRPDFRQNFQPLLAVASVSPKFAPSTTSASQPNLISPIPPLKSAKPTSLSDLKLDAFFPLSE